MPPSFKDVLRDAFRQLRGKGLWHWVLAGVLILGGTYLGDWLGRSPCWTDLRYKLYQRQTNSIRPKLYAQRTVVVLIGDDEYWKGELSRRAPIKRDYLAKLVRKLDSYNPAVIALDFDFRSPTPDGEPRDNVDYVCETQQLLEAIRDVSHNRRIVIPKTIGLYGDKYFTESDVTDGFDFQGGAVLRGYISLPFDKRRVPLALPVQGIGRLDSFAQAIVHADNKKVLEIEGYDTPTYYLPFGTFMGPDGFTTISAKDVLDPAPESVNKVPFKVVIVGAGWSKYALGRGGKIDPYLTPVGEIQGVYLHANYVEALVGEHIYKALDERAVRCIDVVLAISIAVCFALDIKIRWKAGLAVFILLGLILLSYFSLQNIGIFFDFFVPYVLVTAHALFERIRDWRRVFIEHEKRRISGPQESHA